MTTLELLQQNYLATLDMLADFNHRGFSSPEALDILRNTKSMINEMTLNPSTREELMEKSQALLEKAQQMIFFRSEPMGPEFTGKWDKIFKNILEGSNYGEFSIEKSRFMPGLPRDGDWARVRLPHQINEEKLAEISDNLGVRIEKHDENHVIIRGEKSAIRQALKEISTSFKK